MLTLLQVYNVGTVHLFDSYILDTSFDSSVNAAIRSGSKYAICIILVTAKLHPDTMIGIQAKLNPAVFAWFMKLQVTGTLLWR